MCQWGVPQEKYVLFGLITISLCYLLMAYVNWSSQISYLKRNTQSSSSQVIVNVEHEATPKPHFVSKQAFTQKMNESLVNLSPSLETYVHQLDGGFPMQGSLKAPKPAFKLGNIIGKSDIIIGIPTVKREIGDYLPKTVSSLILSRTADPGLIKIVVSIGETDMDYVKKRSKQLQTLFGDEIRLGRLEIISPPNYFYPNWNTTITTTLNDDINRVKWRSKENLDTLFVMMYAYKLSPKYYIMLEDDVLSNLGYDKFIIKETNLLEKKEWFFLSFSGWCSVGKLFRTSTLPSFASFVDMFWNKKPLDWLQRDYVSAAYCREDKDPALCMKEKSKWLYAVKPYVFHHVGKSNGVKNSILATGFYSLVDFVNVQEHQTQIRKKQYSSQKLRGCCTLYSTFHVNL